MDLTATSLLSDLDQLGVQVGAEEGRLWLKPQDAVTPELAERLRSLKVKLLEMLDLPFAEPTADWIRKNETAWCSMADEDVDYAINPRPPMQQCPWCRRWLGHSQACIDLRRSWIPEWPFGKHKGLKINKLPRDYLQWAWDADDIRDADVKEFVREILGIEESPQHDETPEPAV